VRTLAYQVPGQRVGPLKFVETDWFQGVVGLVIIWNIVTCYQQYTRGDNDFLEKSQLIILALYVVEMMLRLGHFGRKFFCNVWVESVWNCTDLVIVGLGVWDEILVTTRNKEIPFLRVLRALRLLRIFRT
ncbi:cac, partial [Symbiodinium microadriaticum]